MSDLYNSIAIIMFYAGMAMYIKCDIWYVQLIGVTISMLSLQYLLVNFR